MIPTLIIFFPSLISIFSKPEEVLTLLSTQISFLDSTMCLPFPLPTIFLFFFPSIEILCGLNPPIRGLDQKLPYGYYAHTLIDS